MTLLENEVKLVEFAKSIILTNYRVLMEEGKLYKISIFLEKISSIETRYKSKHYLILLGIIALIVGIIMKISAEYEDFSLLFFIIGIICIISFFFTRKHVLSISSDGGAKLEAEIKKAPHEIIEKFITSIQEAKQKKNNASR